MKPLAIYTGYNIRYPLGGHVLAELHYIVGLQRLGYEVIIIEESGTDWAPCYNPERGEMSRDPAFGIARLQEVLRPHGLERNWCYVDSDGQYHGLDAATFRDCCRRAELLFSRAGVNWLPEFAECRRRVFVDADPGFTQFKMPVPPVKSCSGYASPHDFQYHFSYGERIGQPDCPIPTHGLRWQPTRPPVVLDLVEQRFTPDAPRFTTVMSWSSRPPILWQGEEYGQKNIEFERVLELPRRCGELFEIALAGKQAPRQRIAENGWVLADPLAVTATIGAYREFIAQSRGEFSVAVNLEVKARSGWFSDRTAAYLASGKPAIVQDTGFSEYLPKDHGLLPFRDLEEAVAAVAAVQADYPAQCRAARRVAEQYFAAEPVLESLLERCEAPVPA